MRGLRIRTVAAALAGVSLMGLATPFVAKAQAQDTARRNFNIPARDMAGALETFGHQSGRDILFDRGQVVGRRSNSVRGSLEPGDALRRLVSGSGLSVSAPNGATFVVGRGSGEADAGSAAANSESADQSATPEILVTGVRPSLNADIRRTEDDTQPYVIFDSASLRDSQSANIEEFLRSRLTMNTTQTSSSQEPFGNRGNQSQINLRGLGTNQTLILIDGRRAPGTFNGTFFDQPNLNGIPISAVDRIVVLPSTASGIYGGGATGGVVNIILKRDYRGGELSLTYGNSFRWDVAERRIDLSVGTRILGTQILIAASRSESGTLRAGERTFGLRERQLLFANNPSSILTDFTPLLGYTSNIRSVNGTNLVLDNGTSLGSSTTFVPAGYRGALSDGGAALVANAGRYNLSLSAAEANSDLVNDPSVNSITVSARRQITSNMEFFADFFWNESRSNSGQYWIFSTSELAANAPNNPFTTPIRVTWPTTALYPLVSNNNSLRASTGLIFNLSHQWRGSAEYIWSRSRYFTSQAFPLFLNAAGEAAIANGTIDILSDLNLRAVDLSRYLEPEPTALGPTESRLSNMTLRLSGPLVRLPGGNIVVSGLLERRTERALGAFNQSFGTTYFSPRSQQVNSFYLETVIPLVGDGNSRPGLRSLELQGAIRGDYYRTRASDPASVSLPTPTSPLPTFGQATNRVSSTDYTLGLRYEPFGGLIMRASIGSGFLPPNVGQINPQAARPPRNLTIVDPRRGGTSITRPVSVTTGGNPDLSPEESRSLSAGIVLAPVGIPGLRLSIDYTRIRKRNEILPSVSVAQLLAVETEFPDRVTRGAPLPGDPSDWAGPVTALNQSAINLARSRVEVVDVQFDYSHTIEGLGRLGFYGIGTWQRRSERQILPTSVSIDSVGYTGGPLEFRANGGVALERGGLNLAWNVQYYDSYLVYAAEAAPSQLNIAVLNQGSLRIRSQMYHDLVARYRFQQSGPLGILNGLEIQFGIKNIFDSRPPIVVGTDYSTYGDPRLRRFVASVRRAF